MSTSTRDLDLYEGINQVTLVPAGASVGRRGKGAGFYCESCNLTFKDSIQYVDHINSRQHLHKIGQAGEEGVKRATLQQVKERIEYLWKKQQKEQESGAAGFDLARRITEREQEIQEEKEKKKQQRKQQREAGEQKEETEEEKQLMETLGIRGFGSSKR